MDNNTSIVDIVLEWIKDFFLGMGTSVAYYGIIGELSHGASVVFWGLAASIVVYFSNRFLSKKFPLK